MAKRGRRNWREIGQQFIHQTDVKQMLDVVLPLDRRVLEMSMSIYNISPNDRHKMREQSRRLHDAVREHLSRFAAALQPDLEMNAQLAPVECVSPHWKR